jgi:hypothetical protein
MSGVPPSVLDYSTPPVVAVWQRRALVIGILGAIGTVIAWVIEPDNFYRGWLLGYMWCFGLTIGSLAVLMIWHLTGGAWGTVSRRILEAATRTMPMMIVFFIPIVIGIHHLYPWSRPDVLQHDPDIRRVAAQYLSLRYFIFRAVLYFILWAVLTYVLNRMSARQDRPYKGIMDPWYRRISGPGLVVYGFTITFASVDWVMSLDPHWTSTIYGLIFMVGQGMMAFSFSVLMLTLLVRRAPMENAVKPDQFLDLGKLMLTTVMLWGWFALSQWLIIWSGNLPDEITWYLNRTRGGWNLWGLAIIVFQFVVPFSMLLSRSRKASAQRLMRVAILLIIVRYVELVYYIMPNFPDSRGHFYYSWTYAVVPIGMAGLWLAYFFHNLRQRPLFAVHDPHTKVLLKEGHEHEVVPL